MRERNTEVASIDIRAFLLGDVDIFTSWAVNLDSRSSEFLTHADWEHVLSFAENTRAHSESAQKIFLSHECESFRRCDESCMDKSINVSCFLVHFQESFVFEIFVVGTFARKNHFNAIIVVIEFLLDAIQVEVIADEIVIDFAKELVVFKCAEPADPTIRKV